MYNQRFKMWLENVQNPELKDELLKISGNDEEIKNRFFKELEFGTGGLRGVLGAGSNLMNEYTVGRATQGIANYMRENGLKRAAVSHDSRHFSREFACLVCEIFAANGIESYITKELMPTPFLSFCVRELKADMGVMITASHNPGKYNGYKVYGADGCQLATESAERIMDAIRGTDIFKDVRRADFEQCVSSGLIKFVDDTVEEKYLNHVINQRVNPCQSSIKVVYTPLNGAGYRICPKALKLCGATNLSIVEAQSTPSGDFATCPYPNPETREALYEGLVELKNNNADLLIATDPDADRMGLALLDSSGNEVLLSGNETGALLMDYLLSERKIKGTLPKNPLVVKTIVSSNICEKIAKKYGAQIINVLTGFKYIGQQIYNLEQEAQQERFVFGFEESYGYLAGSYVRDKDAVLASCLALELATHLKKQGKTLKQRMDELYAEFGYYKHKLLNFEFAGAQGFEDMMGLMERLRKNPPSAIANVPIAKITDYMQYVADYIPFENVLVFSLEGGAEVIVRPSGTEPKLKAYLTTSGERELAERNSLELEKAITAIIKE